MCIRYIGRDVYKVDRKEGKKLNIKAGERGEEERKKNTSFSVSHVGIMLTV